MDDATSQDRDEPVTDGRGVSWEKFSAALAGLFSPERQGSAARHATSETDASVDAPGESGADEMAVTPRAILEALLFVGHPQLEPLTAEAAAGSMRGVSPAEIDELVAELNAQYLADACPYEITSRGAGYLLVLRPEFEALGRQIDGRLRQARLSRASVETLSLVAYNQPITAEEVSRLRGIPCGAILTQLVRRNLLRIDRSESEPRRGRFRTTERFLELLGLPTLEDLPQREEVEPM